MIRHEDLQALAEEVLGTDQHFLEKVIPARENTKYSHVPTFLNGSGSDWIVNNAFLSLPLEEIKFALRFHLTPQPPLSPWKSRSKILFSAFRVAVLTMVYVKTKSWMAVFLMFGFTQFGFGDRWDYQRKAKHLEAILSKTDDLISARTYLVRHFGKAYFSVFGYPILRDSHPIGAYVKYGKDERIKAILRSDLEHPLRMDSQS